MPEHGHRRRALGRRGRLPDPAAEAAVAALQHARQQAREARAALRSGDLAGAAAVVPVMLGVAPEPIAGQGLPVLSLVADDERTL